MSGNKPVQPTYYGEYLMLDKLLGAQAPKSAQYGKESHDETLFIIVHQVYELWFKQILHELNLVVDCFKQNSVEEKALAKVVSALERIKKIQLMLVQQFDVLETMTPMDFLEFRNLLVPASGFQSVQFRQIEIMLGLSTDQRYNVDRQFFLGRLNEADKQSLLKIEAAPSLFALVEKWLERLPFTQFQQFDFWQEYKKTVDNILASDEKIIQANWATLSEVQKEVQMEDLKSTRQTFASLFDEKLHQQLIKEDKRRLSHRATLNALFILLYRDEPLLQHPFQFLTGLMDIDENFTTWRHRHAILANRMLGTKIGTGGSSGHLYLKKAADQNRIYLDLFNLSTFLVPRSQLPVLPKHLKVRLDFNFSLETQK